VTPNLTYVYCLVRSAKRPVLRGARAGVPAARPPRALDAGGDLWVIAADVPETEYGEAVIAHGLQNIEWVSRRALGHERMVERFLGRTGLLPMQLFTLFTSDERALAHVARERRRIDRLLDRLDGQVEWGVRVTWDERVAREAVEKVHKATGARKPPSGAAYLSRKRDLLDVNRATLATARKEATRLFREMSKEATDARRRASTEQAAPGSRLLLDAAYLVAAAHAAAFRKALDRRTRDIETSGLAVSLTGPWPPYNFISGKSR